MWEFGCKYVHTNDITSIYIICIHYCSNNKYACLLPVAREINKEDFIISLRGMFLPQLFLESMIMSTTGSIAVCMIVHKSHNQFIALIIQYHASIACMKL